MSACTAPVERVAAAPGRELRVARERATPRTADRIVSAALVAAVTVVTATIVLLTLGTSSAAGDSGRSESPRAAHEATAGFEGRIALVP